MTETVTDGGGLGEMKNLQKRGDKWYVRVAVPTDLAALYAPSKEIRRSLQTGDRRDAERRLHAALVAIEDEFAQKRQALSAAQREGEYLTSPAFRSAVEASRDVGALVHAADHSSAANPFRAVVVRDGDNTRIDYVLNLEPPSDNANLPTSRGSALFKIENAIDALEAQRAQTTLAVGFDNERHPVWAVPEWMLDDVTACINGLFDAKIKTLEAQRTQIEAQNEQAATDTGRLSDLLGPWKAERNPAPRTVMEAETAIALFEKVCGPLAYKDISPAHCADFKAYLLGTDKAAQTKSKQWAMIRTLLNTAKGNRLIEKSPMEGIRFAPPDDSETREPLTKADFQAFYTREPQGTEDWWLFRICQYTGARLAEIAQLTRNDVTTEDGVKCFRITRREGKRAKTKSSVRFVPLHKQLLADGLEQWLPEEGPLFARGHAAYSKRLNRRLDLAGVDDKNKCVHSTRHSFISACRQAGIDQDTWGRITGHIPQSVGQRYGDHGPEGLKTAIDKIRFGTETV